MNDGITLKEKHAWDYQVEMQMVNDGITLKEKHAWDYQVEMQMVITKIHKSIVIIFTDANHDVYECSVDFDNQFQGVIARQTVILPCNLCAGMSLGKKKISDTFSRSTIFPS